ncbi:unnamed protein product [Diatraea saccharalis]|uniref:SUI1 domain-containing protein n=1 Tax=Diatraea saccharalis TaxID=40085 RepID=A0A9N9QTG3_9NEOP|nr:unnamed protein product [Diatraea saccharalis]
MFAKSYKLKSNNTLKNSEKKNLIQRVVESFPGVTEDTVKEIVPVKSNSSCMKVVLHSGVIVNVYVVDGAPMIIEDEKGMLPTVCALWKVPQLVPTLIIHTPVLSKVAGGAPLYLPGVERWSAGGPGRWTRGAAVAACTRDNCAAALVGRATLDHNEMRLMAAGVCLDIIHVFGDQLCKDIKFNKIERPKLGTASYPEEDIAELATELSEMTVHPLKEEWPSLIPTPAPSLTATPVPHQPRLITEHPPQEPDEDNQQLHDKTNIDDGDAEDGNKVQDIPLDMDGLLHWCLLSFLKLNGKRIELPLKTNLLYKNHLMPLCPADRTLDIKKSSYKKLGKFLEAMQQEGLVEVREIEKGVSALVALHLAHPQVRAHSPPAPVPAPASVPPPPGGYVPPRIMEVYCLTAAAVDIFPEHKKGTVLDAEMIRSGVSQYVRAKSLQTQQRIKLDNTLAKILHKNAEEVVPWDEVMRGVQAVLTAATLLEDDGGTKLIRSRLPPVTMTVATRAGNKKVTLVSNLEAFGFRLGQLTHEVQQQAAAAASVTRSPGSKHDQLMLQGDQTHFIAKLLIEKYGLPKKYLEGADKALKKKK